MDKIRNEDVQQVGVEAIDNKLKETTKYVVDHVSLRHKEMSMFTRVMHLSGMS